MTAIDTGGNDTEDVCVCGHTRFGHYCFGGYCLRGAVMPLYQGADGCRSFRMDLTLPGVREAIARRRAAAARFRLP